MRDELYSPMHLVLEHPEWVTLYANKPWPEHASITAYDAFSDWETVEHKPGDKIDYDCENGSAVYVVERYVPDEITYYCKLAPGSTYTPRLR